MERVEDSSSKTAAIEIIVGVDGKVRLPRVMQGEGKFSQAAAAAARKYQYEPTTFDGVAVQVIRILVFPEKGAS
jgi:hypothetical protein